MIQWIVALAIVALIVLSLYQVRIIKRINTKLRKLMEPDRDPRAIAKENMAQAWQHYRQTEYYSQLLSALQPTAPLPPLRSWAASPDLLVTLFYLARREAPSVIVDLGSGASTLILAKAAPAATIFSIDNSAEYAAKTEAMLKEHGVTNVKIRIAPLTRDSAGVDWYQRDALADIPEIDLLFVDGPPGSKDSSARHPAFHELHRRLSPRAVVVIDDVHREGEMRLAEMFKGALSSHSLEVLNHEKGTAVIKPA